LRWAVFILDARGLLRVDLGAWVSPIKHPAAQKGAVAGALYAVGLTSSGGMHGLIPRSFPRGLVAVHSVVLLRLLARVRE